MAPLSNKNDQTHVCMLCRSFSMLHYNTNFSFMCFCKGSIALVMCFKTFKCLRCPVFQATPIYINSACMSYPQNMLICNLCSFKMQNLNISSVLLDSAAQCDFCEVGNIEASTHCFWISSLHFLFFPYFFNIQSVLLVRLNIMLLDGPGMQ